MTALGDSIWLKQLSRYDDIGVKLLFERYYTPLVLFSKSYVLDQDVAKDIVQDVFLVMIQEKERFVTIEHLKTYLYTTVKNRCLKYLRHEDVKLRYHHYVISHEGEEDGYLDKVLEEEVFVLLQQAVEELPEQCRKVFMLAMEGKGNAEIADIMNVGLETVKSHKKSGKKILYNRLKDVMPVAGWMVIYFHDLIG